jgi:hypothetical protein
MKLSARQIGAVGVARVAGALFRNGYSVLTPMEDFSSYDLVAERDGIFHRIQIKTTSKPESDRVDYIICWAMDEDLFWILKPQECRSTTKKFYPKSGSSWRIINDF